MSMRPKLRCGKRCLPEYDGRRYDTIANEHLGLTKAGFLRFGLEIPIESMVVESFPKPKTCNLLAPNQ